jgi:hypothetical protein
LRAFPNPETLLHTAFSELENAPDYGKTQRFVVDAQIFGAEATSAERKAMLASQSLASSFSSIKRYALIP